MKNLRVILLLIFVPALYACATITSTQMLGENVYLLDPMEWDGTWIIEKDSFQLEVVDKIAGKIEIRSIAGNKVEVNTLFIRQSGKSNYINFIDEENNYFFAKFKKNKNQVIVWLPSKNEFQQAIKNNEIEGNINKRGDVQTTASSESFNKYVTANSRIMIFQYEEPGVFRRLSE